MLGVFVKITHTLVNRSVQKWRKNHPERQARIEKENGLRKRYGLTVEKKEARLKQQNGRCAVCDVSEPKGRGWCTDHNHQTGQLRSELCHRCNTVLGLIEEKISILNALEAYILKWSEFNDGSNEEPNAIV